MRQTTALAVSLSLKHTVVLSAVVSSPIALSSSIGTLPRYLSPDLIIFIPDSGFFQEGGLLGSAAVSKDYAARGVNVVGMSQFDMTAWVKAGTKESVGIITDFVDPEYVVSTDLANVLILPVSLTEFNKKLVDEYLDIPYVLTKCGYACSDQYVHGHFSWIYILLTRFLPALHGTRLATSLFSRLRAPWRTPTRISTAQASMSTIPFCRAK